MATARFAPNLSVRRGDLTEQTVMTVNHSSKTPSDLDFGQPEVVAALWDAFYQRLRFAVRDRVRDIRRPTASESEVALSAFHSFVGRAREGQFPKIADEDELWRLLKTFAIRKANDLRKNLRAQKRGGDHAVYNQAELANDSHDIATGVDAATEDRPSPSLELEISELFNAMLEQLPDDRHRDLILLKLQGAPISLIAEHLSTTTRTVQRMLKKIESEWQTHLLET